MTTLPEQITVIEIAAPARPTCCARPSGRCRSRSWRGAGEARRRRGQPADVAQRQGNYPPPPGASDIPGLEIAGTVVALGPGAKQFKLGDTLCALVTGHGYAEYCAAPEAQCLPVPKGFSMVEAAALPENYFTVWTNLMERGGLKRARAY